MTKPHSATHSLNERSREDIKKAYESNLLNMLPTKYKMIN